MWNLIQFLFYDLPYFIYRSADNLKWDAVIIFCVYQLGRISGMRLFKKYLEAHFPILQSEDAQWKLWVMKQIESLGGAKFIPQKEYRGVGRSKKLQARNFALSSKSSPRAINQEGNTMKTIVLDAGHGGPDSGAKGATGKLEKDFNLAMVLKVEALLINNPEVMVKVTRSTDVFVELIDRAKIANDLNADLFLSIHANSATLPTTGGTETLYTRQDSRPFAEFMHGYILSATGLKDRKAKYQNLSVGRNTKMPGILLEPLFISNKYEESMAFDPAFQDKLAIAIAKGLCAFLGVPYSETTAPPVQTPGLTAISVMTEVNKADNPLTGYLLNSVSWVPARPVLDYLKPTWTFKEKQIILEGSPIETMLIDNQAYIKSRDLQTIGARVFFDNATAPKRIDIFPKLEVAK